MEYARAHYDLSSDDECEDQLRMAAVEWFVQPLGNLEWLTRPCPGGRGEYEGLARLTDRRQTLVATGKTRLSARRAVICKAEEWISEFLSEHLGTQAEGEQTEGTDLAVGMGAGKRKPVSPQPHGGGRAAGQEHSMGVGKFERAEVMKNESTEGERGRAALKPAQQSQIGV